MGLVSSIPLTIRVRRNSVPEAWAGHVVSVAGQAIMAVEVIQEKRGYSGTMYLNSTFYVRLQYIRGTTPPA